MHINFFFGCLINIPLGGLEDGRNCAKTLVIEPMSSSSNYTSSPLKSKVVGSKFTSILKQKKKMLWSLERILMGITKSRLGML